MKKWLVLFCIWSVQSAQQVVSFEQMQQRFMQFEEKQKEIARIVEETGQKGSKISSKMFLFGAQNTIPAVQLSFNEEVALLFGFFEMKIERKEAALNVKYYDLKKPEIATFEKVEMIPASERVIYEKSKKCSLLNLTGKRLPAELKEVVKLIVPVLKEMQ